MSVTVFSVYIVKQQSYLSGKEPIEQIKSMSIAIVCENSSVE